MDASIELYELNRSIIEQQGTIKEEDIARAKKKKKNFVEETKNMNKVIYVSRNFNALLLYSPLPLNYFSKCLLKIFYYFQKEKQGAKFAPCSGEI